MLYSMTYDSSSSLDSSCVTFSDLSAWIDMNLCANESAYSAPLPHPFSGLDRPTAHSFSFNDGDAGEAMALGHMSAPSTATTPVLTSTLASKLSSHKPLSLNGFSSTMIHLVTTSNASLFSRDKDGGEGRDLQTDLVAHSIRSLDMREDDTELGESVSGSSNDAQDDSAGVSMDLGRVPLAWRGSADGSSTQTQQLPHLNLQGTLLYP